MLRPSCATGVVVMFTLISACSDSEYGLDSGRDSAPLGGAPVAEDDAGTVAEEGTVVVNLIANDTDPDDDIDPSTVAVVTTPRHGSVEVHDDGTVTYTHDGSETSEDSFGYTVADRQGFVSDEATVTLSITAVNDAPVATDDTASVDEGAAVVVSPLGNDTDADDGIAVATLAVVAAPSHGTAMANGDGTVTYTHDGSETTSDSFAYEVSDTAGTPSNAATVQMSVTPVNDAPVATDDAATVAEGASVAIDLATNDSDADDGLDAASIAVSTQPGQGTVDVHDDGTVTYTHDGSETTSDSFTYTIDDASGATSAPATVQVTVTPVNDAPVANDDSATVDEGASVEIDLAANDSDAEGGLDPSSIVLASQPAHGTVDVDTDGTVAYTHDGSETTSDSFTYTIDDASGATSAAATVTLDVTEVNDPPVANPDAGSVDAGQSVEIDLAANDTDSDGTIAPGSIQVASQPGSGSVQVHADGTVTYTHDGSAGASDSFTYTVTDDDGEASAPATVSVTVTCGPIGLDDTFSDNGTASFQPPATDYDASAYTGALQSDGSILFGGRYYISGTGRVMTIARVTPAGALDTDFGTEGYTDPFAGQSAAYGMAVRSDDTIVVSGEVGGTLTVLQLDADGAIDTDFGTEGTVTQDGISVHFSARDHLALQSDGGVVVAGHAGGDFKVVRYDSSGTLDTDFGTEGIATADVSGGDDIAMTLLLQPDDRIVVGGNADGDFGLARFEADGTLDDTFGTDGVLVTDITGSADEVHGMALDDGDLIAVGCGNCSYSYTDDVGWAVARYAADGTLDETFDDDGILYDPIPSDLVGGGGVNDQAWALQLLSDGDLFVAGQVQKSDGAGRMLFARYGADGALDTCFNAGGYYVQHSWDVFAQSDVAYRMLAQPDGRIVAIGSVNPSAGGSMGVLRFDPLPE